MNEQEPSGKPSIFGTHEAAAETPSEHESASAPPRDLDNDLVSVLLAASSPLTLLAIQDELNAPGRGDHVPTGPIDRALDDMTGGDRPRVTVVKLGDPVVEHYALSPTYRAEIESPGLVVEKRALILGAVLAPFAIGEDDGERDEGDGFPMSELIEIMDERGVAIGESELAEHTEALVTAGIFDVRRDDEDASKSVYVFAKGVPGKLLAIGAPALARTTLPAKEASPFDLAAEAKAEEDRKAVESYIARLNERHDEQERRALHFQGEAHKFAQRSAKYEQWARRGGFNIAEITGQVDASARGQGVPWVVLRMVDERELRRLLTEEDKLNESLTASKKSFESAKRAYEATKSQLEEKLALVKQAQRSTSYAPEKMVRRIIRDLMVEVVSDDAHDYGMHLDWEELREEDREEEPEVVVPEPPVKTEPASTITEGSTTTTHSGHGPCGKVTFGPGTGAPAEVVVQVSRREDGTTASTFAGSVPGPVAPTEDRRVPDGKQYAGKLGPADLADAMTATFLNEEWGIRRNDVQAHFEAIHGALPEGGEKAIGPALRLLEGRGTLLAGDVPGSSSTAEPTRLYWHVSFKDPRTAPPPAPLEPAPKPARKVKEKAVKAPAADDAPKDKAKTKEPTKASKRAKKAASK